MPHSSASRLIHGPPQRCWAEVGSASPVWLSATGPAVSMRRAQVCTAVGVPCSFLEGRRSQPGRLATLTVYCAHTQSRSGATCNSSAGARGPDQFGGGHRCACASISPREALNLPERWRTAACPYGRRRPRGCGGSAGSVCTRISRMAWAKARHRLVKRGAAVAVAAQGLAGKKLVAPMRDTCSFLPCICGAKALGGVLDHAEPPWRAAMALIRPCRPTCRPQADRHDGSGGRRDGSLDQGGSMLQSPGDVDELFPAAPGQHDGLGRGGKGEGVVMTSWPGPMPSAIRAIKSASVPLATVMQCLAPVAASLLNSATSGPMMNWPWSSTAWMRASMLGEGLGTGLEVDELHAQLSISSQRASTSR